MLMNFNSLIIIVSISFLLSCKGNNTTTNNPETLLNINTTDSLSTYKLNIITDNLIHELGEIDMGIMHSGEIIKSSFTVVNNTGKPIIIIDASATCGCLSASYNTKPVKSGDNSKIEYIYNSRGKIGEQHTNLTIKTNQGIYRIGFIVNIKE